MRGQPRKGGGAVKHLMRVGVLALAMLVTGVAAAWAIEFDDILDMTSRGVADRAIIEEIIKDGRPFELDDQDLSTLQDGGVSRAVISAMEDPSAAAREYGRDEGDTDDQSYDNGDNGDSQPGYSSDFDSQYR